MQHSEITLINLLGNRDIQILEKDVPHELKPMFVSNNSDPNYHVLNKVSDNHNCLFQNSKNLYSKIKAEEFDISIVHCPMVFKAIEELITKEKSIQKIILISTKQLSPHAQDSYYIGEIIKIKLEAEKFDGEIENIPLEKNPVSFYDSFDFFEKLLRDNMERQKTVYVHNSGGTPQMRNASEFAGLFKDISYMNFVEHNESNISSMLHKEAQILQHITKELLDNHDYAGIKSIFSRDKLIKDICMHAIARLSLDYKKAKGCFQQFKKKRQTNYDFEIDDNDSISKLGSELLKNAFIKYKQENWGDFLWRLFTIKDNLLIPYVEEYTDGKIIYNPKSGHEEWNKLIKSKTGLESFLKDQEVNGKKLDFTAPNSQAYYYIIKHAFENNFEFNNINKDAIDYVYKALNELGSLRNHIAHRYEGINKEMIQNKIPKILNSDRNKKIELLLEQLKKVLNIEESECLDHDYKLLNKEIQSQIESRSKND